MRLEIKTKSCKHGGTLRFAPPLKTFSAVLFRNQYQGLSCMKTSKAGAIEVVVVLLFTVLVLAGVKDFAVWNQVLYIWGGRPNPFLTSPTELGAHGLRYALLYPLLRFAETTGIHHDILFTTLALPNLLIVIRNVRKSTAVVVGRTHIQVGFALFNALLFAFLFLQMNGRMTLAFFGFSLVIYNINYIDKAQRHRRGSALQIFIGLLFCGVSSGTMAAAFLISLLAFFKFSLYEIIRLRMSRSKTLAVVAIAAAAYSFGVFVFIGLIKNLTFYGGGPAAFIEMLKHGAGVFIYPLLENGLILALLLIIPVALLVFIMKSERPFLTLQIILSLSCGLFGFSTMTLATIPIMIWIGGIWHRTPPPVSHPASDKVRHPQNRRARALQTG